MIRWAIIFFIISVIAGVFGYSGIAAGSAVIAKTLFFIALTLFVLFLVAALTVGKALTRGNP